MLKRNHFVFALLVFSQNVPAAQPPDAGSTIQQIPQTPKLKKTVPEMKVKPGALPAASSSDQSQMTIKALHVAGANLFSEAELIAVTGFAPGSKLSLPDLQGMAGKIGDYYHRHGYFVAQAYLPEQDIKDGSVSIAVIEGKYGKVTLQNESDFSDASLPYELLAGISSGEVIAIAPLETRLLLLSDLPGVNVKSTLSPGASFGTSDLLVEIIPGRRITGSVDADNQGNRYTGKNRLGATLIINYPTDGLNGSSGLGDTATLRAFTSASGLSYARASYQLQFGRAKLGIAFSNMKYSLGQDFASSQANGTAQIASFSGSYPLIRSREKNLYAQFGFDSKSFQDRLDLVADKGARVWMANLNGDHRDNFAGGGMSSYVFTWSSGNINLQNPTMLDIDAATAQSNGHYNKLAFNTVRLQNITETMSLNAGLNGQFASKNLDTSEKMELGGANAVRAYPEGEAFGDQGYVLNLEVHKQLPKFSERMLGQMRLVGFIDTGTVILNKNPWSAEQNRRTLSGAGVGLNWMDSAFMLKVNYAHKVGSALATSAPDAMNRFWVQGVKYF